jgi:hypothetical protein
VALDEESAGMALFLLRFTGRRRLRRPAEIALSGIFLQ